MDDIRVKGILCRVHLGVSEEERAVPQVVVVDAAVKLDLEAAANTDDLSLTTDYADLVKQIRVTAQEKPYHLVEALAGRCCSALLANPKIEAVKVVVRKRPRDLEGIIDSVEVEMLRGNT